MKQQIVSANWLNQNLSDNKLVILDASPESTVGGKVSAHPDLYIPNARTVNIKKHLTDQSSAFPNTVPTEFEFQKFCQSIGINEDSKIVVYDNLGVYTAPRVWWLFKLMGHESIAVLDGGLPEWIKQGFESVGPTDLKTTIAKGNFKANINPEFVIKYEAVIENVSDKKFTIVDARPNGRFNGTADEPRKHLQSGSIPNSVNIPHKSLLDDGKFKSVGKLKQLFNDQQLSTDDQIVFSCGSGLTACIVMLASEIAFKKSLFLFDGSWTEFAERGELKK